MAWKYLVILRELLPKLWTIVTYVFKSPSQFRKKSNLNANGVHNENFVGNKVKLYNTRPSSLGLVTEENGGHWSEIENMSPMSATDKVTGFLLQSQAMLQNYSQLHNMEMPDVRLEITNKYEPNQQNNEDIIDEIRDIKLEATICRNSPKRVQNDVTTNHQHKKKAFSIIDIKDKSNHKDLKPMPDANFINFTDDSSTEHAPNQKTTAVWSQLQVKWQSSQWLQDSCGAFSSKSWFSFIESSLVQRKFILNIEIENMAQSDNVKCYGEIEQVHEWVVSEISRNMVSTFIGNWRKLWSTICHSLI